MKKRTVYLSKSNAANPDHVMFVRRYLQSLGFIVEEFTGGSYDPKSVLPASMFVMVGYVQKPSTHNYYMVGKGQYNQLYERCINRKSDNFYVIDFEGIVPIFRRYEIGSVSDENSWAINYGSIKPSTPSSLQVRSFEILLEKEYEPIVLKRGRDDQAIDCLLEETERESSLWNTTKVKQHQEIMKVGFEFKVHLACITLLQ